MDFAQLEKEYEMDCEHGNKEKSCDKRCDDHRCHHRCARHGWEGCRVNGCSCLEFKNGKEEETERC